MLEILNKYCNKEHGLLLFNPPTGSGKTHSVLKWIYDNYKEYCKESRKVFFITNLKKNLPHQQLRDDFFEPNNDLLEFDKYVTFLDSNSECLIKRFEDVEASINDYFKNHKIFYSIKNTVSEIKKHESNPSLKTFVNKLKDELRNDYEPKFRRIIEKFLKDGYSNSQERIKAIQHNKELQWIGELYPAVFSSKRKVFFLSIDKFYHKNSTLVEPSYSFLEHDITKEAIIFIDEFDATKDNILNNIIEKGKRQRIDFIHLFTEIYWALSNNIFPQKFITHSKKREELIENGYGLPLNQIHNTLLTKAEEIVDKYQLDFSFKTTQIDEDNDNQRNLLFHDFQYHSVYRNDKKFIKIYPNEIEKVNEITFEDKRPKGENIVQLLTEIKGYINYFSGITKSIAENYQQLEEERRNSKSGNTEFTFNLSLSSVIEEFGLESRHKTYIIDNILSARERPRRKQNGSVELNYDLSFYENGFRYYDFVDDDSHQSKTKTFIYNFQNTPEKFILKLAEKSKIIGISATALIQTVTGNYDINYFKRQLGKNYIELDESEKQKLTDLFNLQNKYYEKVNIHSRWLSFLTKGDSVQKVTAQFEDLLEDSDLAQHIVRKLSTINPNTTEYHYNRYLKIGSCFKEFLLKDDIKGFLCLLNKEPKWNDKDLSLNTLEEIFKFLIEGTTKTEKLFTDSKGVFRVQESYTIINSNDFDSKKHSFITQLVSGRKVFIISMYQTIGAGQNLQFISPNPEKLINIRDESLIAWNINNETDINAIYLDKPTHIIQQINLNLNEEGFIRYLFQLEFLTQVGLISIYQLNRQVTIAFRHLLASFNTTKKPESPNNGFLYGDDNIKQHFAKYIIQAIGRICRTNLKSPNIYVYADAELDKLICDFNIEDNLVLKEFETLVKSSRTKIDQEKNEDSKLKTLAKSTNQKVHSKIKKFISPNWGWSESQRNEWENLRRMCLSFPTISEKEVLQHNLNRVLDLYIELPSPNNKYYFEIYESDEVNDYQIVDIDFKQRMKSEISQKAARLEELLSIDGVEDHFRSNNWSVEFANNDYMLPPVLFNNIYKGALGEQIGKYIFENHYKIELEELPLENYELFDFRMKNTNTYIDFKHWKESTQIGFQDQQAKIYQKLDRVNGDQVYIINILSTIDREIIKSSDGKIVEIPFLWNQETKQLNHSIMNQLVHEVQ